MIQGEGLFKGTTCLRMLLPSEKEITQRLMRRTVCVVYFDGSVDLLVRPIQIAILHEDPAQLDEGLRHDRKI
jgi:hypothetical protein